MNATLLQTQNLKLVPQLREDVRAQVEQMEPHEKVELSPAWLALLDGSSPVDPWIHGFMFVHRTDGNVIGRGGFKGPPGADGAVEIAYGVAPEHQGKGYAIEAAAALVSYAFSKSAKTLRETEKAKDFSPWLFALTTLSRKFRGFERLPRVGSNHRHTD